MRIFRILRILPVITLLGGCQMVLLGPSGDVALQQRNLLIAATALMLLIIVPVMALTVAFAWRYRASAKAGYDPDWNHSLPLEVVIWSVPLLIIIVIGAMTWMGTHLLDPYRPLNRISAAKPVAEANAQPLVVQVVALDWKWLFIYPEQGVASLNEAVAPVDRPIEFRITSSSVMNSLFIPALAGQIYAMPGMQTKLNAVINHPGEFEGFSANYSGAGFSDMRFSFRGVDEKGFDDWVQGARDKGAPLGRAEYRVLERPSEREAVRYFRDMPADLFDAVLNRCVDPLRMCTRDMTAMDASGGGGREGINLVARLEGAETARRGGRPVPALPFVTAICTPADVYGTAGISARGTD
ncbi:ubiquinol oxidase subunit II [Bosea sp. (in: a-proteobacteria)]|uniref:ubiquinol oxidase subunit II n=1 Tax=Bosea sp. (in: a-proteobacteria) TaxID=1871050 RepID=UPI002622204D|nr:ubiquinol oxidase subunit II [Bosea sp. (in: a-proteobacteria)]MCO5089992.1 ubiquinol oxidase subunit II [Bosea sp. (in: a-proteobacteria)]